MFHDLQKTDIGLYIGLRDGGELDLRVAAHAALSFDSFMRKLVEAIEPGTDIELNLIQGEIGSLNLISSIKARVSKHTLKALALVAAGWLGGEISSFGVQEVLAYLFSGLTEEQVQEIGENDLRRLAEACVKATTDPQIAASHKELTTTLAEDEDVTGVGMTLPGEKTPRRVMPRRDFPAIAERAQILQQADIEGDRRMVPSTKELILTEPVLIDKPRKWRFLMGKQEISATITDEIFRQKALQGKLGVPLSQGITIKARVITTEEKLEADLWKPVKYEIAEVLDWKANPGQGPLFTAVPDDEEE